MPAERINVVKRTVASAAAAGPITSKAKVLKTKAPAAATATAVAIEALDPAKKPVAVDEDIESKPSPLTYHTHRSEHIAEETQMGLKLSSSHTLLVYDL